MSRASSWFFANWANISAAFGVLALSILASYWDHFSIAQRCLLANFGILSLHFWEEFVIPGGLPSVWNVVGWKTATENADHYPLNQRNAVLGNWWFLFLLYLPPVFCNTVSWFTLVPIVFGLVCEVFMHLVAFNIVLGTCYNPGLFTSLGGFLPVGIVYLVHYAGQHPVLDWVKALGFALSNYVFIFYFVGIYMLAKPGDDRYAFTKDEMDRFSRTRYNPITWLKVYRDNWYYVVGVGFFAGAYFMAFFGHLFSQIQSILIWNTLAVAAHQIEEYIIPGGTTLIINVALFNERRDYDRYPLNKKGTAVVNTLAYPFFLAPVLWPNEIWLGLTQVFFGVAQIFAHGLAMNIGVNMGYNPGLATAVLLHLPIAVHYIAYVQDHDLVRYTDFLYAIPLLLAATVVIVLVPIRLNRDRQSPYPFTPEEMARFNVLNKLKANHLVDEPLAPTYRDEEVRD